MTSHIIPAFNSWKAFQNSMQCQTYAWRRPWIRLTHLSLLHKQTYGSVQNLHQCKMLPITRLHEHFICTFQKFQIISYGLATVVHVTLLGWMTSCKLRSTALWYLVRYVPTCNHCTESDSAMWPNRRTCMLQYRCLLQLQAKHTSHIQFDSIVYQC